MEVKEFILETLLPYKENPELISVDVVGDCVYQAPNGNKCALGKWIKNKYLKKIKAEYLNSSEAFSIFERFRGEKFLKKKARKMNFTIEDWIKIQDVHDTKLNLGDIKLLEDHFKIKLPELCQ